MKALSDRIERLEAARRHGDTATRVVLIAPRGELTAEQQRQAEAARAAGRELFTINIQPRHEPLPSAARPSYKRLP